MKNPGLISVVLPVYNEEDCLLSQLRVFVQLWQELIQQPIELIVVENGSTDKTWSVLQIFKKQCSIPIRLFRLTQPSYGQALKTGILNSRGECVLCIDIDYFDFDFIQRAVDILRSESNVFVVGSKLHKDSKDERRWDRRITTRLLSVIFRIFLKYQGTDTHGLKGFVNDFQLKQGVRQCVARDELFDSELLLRLSNNGQLTIIDLPVTVKEIRKSRYMAFSRYGRAAVDLLRVMRLAIFGEYCRGRLWPIVADDFGYSRITDSAIIQGVKEGGISYISVLGNMVSDESLRSLKKIRKKVGVSLHLNFVEGLPILSKTLVSTLVDVRGRFYPLPQFLWRLLRGKISIYELEKELIAQYERLSFYAPAQHLDSHQHTHHFGIIQRVIENNYVLMGRPSIRSMKSSSYYLIRKPLRFLVFHVLRFTFLAFGNKEMQSKDVVDETIVHIGFNYD